MIRLAIIGTSWIATEFIKGCNIAGGFSLSAVYSRSEEKGRQFGAEFGCTKVYTSLKELADDSSIDAVYIASPNVLHADQSELMLKSGKHVICEKPICVTPEQFEKLSEIARQNHLVYMEAIMYRHLAARQVLRDNLYRVGKICHARIDFCQLSAKYEAYLNGEMPNIFNPEMATGTLMDLGVYCVYPVIDLFGIPQKITSFARFLSTGSDGFGCSMFEYPDMLAELTYSKIGEGGIGSEIIGDKGTLLIRSISRVSNIDFVTKDGTVTPIYGAPSKPELMSGEAASFRNYITDPEKFAKEYEEVTELTLNVSKAMRDIRNLAGIYFK